MTHFMSKTIFFLNFFGAAVEYNLTGGKWLNHWIGHFQSLKWNIINTDSHVVLDDLAPFKYETKYESMDYDKYWIVR